MELEEEDSSSSDVELQGVELDVDEEPEEDTQLADLLPAATAASKEDEDAIAALENADHNEMEEARKERMELVAAEAKKVLAGQKPATVQESLEYLMSQSDVFAHFLAGSVAAAGQKGKKGSRGKTNRMTEAEEDAALLKSAKSKRTVIRLDKQPSILAPHCKMHPYQLEGLNWLIKLHDCGINGILADEMGLGKTLQTISLLAYLRQGRGVRGPHLVIVPKSVVGNWMREFRMWCPAIRPMRMGGTKDERIAFMDTGFTVDAATGKKNCNFDVLITSYEGIAKEKGRLSKVDWRYV
jgi:SWI/SNF-related matrix-associated actin-dependent regulator of chromatin subfamily A member 5